MHNPTNSGLPAATEMMTPQPPSVRNGVMRTGHRARLIASRVLRRAPLASVTGIISVAIATIVSVIADAGHRSPPHEGPNVVPLRFRFFHGRLQHVRHPEWPRQVL